MDVHLLGVRAARRATTGPDRPAGGQHAGVRAGRGLRPVPGGRGRAVPGRGPAGPGVPGRAGADRGAVRGLTRSGRRASGCTAPVTWCGGGPTGELEFLGRADDQVKMRGFRVEPGEIEAVLARQPRASAAVAVRSARTGPATGGWSPTWSRRPERGAGTGDRAAGTPRRRLPEYMVPVGVRRAGRLPLTANGKLDRRGAARARTSAGPRRPWRRATPQEEVLCGLFAEVLGLARGRGRRQLLRPGRALAAGHPAGQPGAGGARRPSWRSGRCSRPRPWPGWPRLLDGAGPARAALVRAGRPPGARCRCRSRSGGCGSCTG